MNANFMPRALRAAECRGSRLGRDSIILRRVGYCPSCRRVTPAANVARIQESPLAQDAASPPDARRHAPAARRNREPISRVLAEVLPAAGLVVEVAAGTGEHALHFAAAFPHLSWLPTDPDPDALASIAAWAAEAGLPNLLPPRLLDARRHPWPVADAVGNADAVATAPRVQAVVCINMIHIAPWEACVGLMAGAAEVLVPGGPLFLYGPFMRDGRHTAPSNEAFDASLRATDPRFGVRDLGDVAAEAAAWGLDLERHVAMPANNLSVVFRNSAERIPGRRVRGAHAPPHVSS